MILNRDLYTQVSFLKSWMIKRKMRLFSNERIFKTFNLHRTIWPTKLYFYSPRLKGKPRFIGSQAQLSNWKDAKLCETICPTHAIKVTAEAIIIDDRGCISCGLCVEISPEGILEMQNAPAIVHRS